MNYINIDPRQLDKITQELNKLLADYQVYYQKLRNYHWNVTGESFFDLHVKFEEMYNDSLLKIDEIAERLLTLRQRPLSNYSEYLKHATVKESLEPLSSHEMVNVLLSDHGLLIHQLKKVNAAADVAGDEGTLDIVSTYIKDLEKISWMLEAYNSKLQPHQPIKALKAKAVKAKASVKAKKAKASKK